MSKKYIKPASKKLAILGTVKNRLNALDSKPTSFEDYRVALGYKTVKAVKDLFKKLRSQGKVPKHGEKGTNEYLFGTNPIRKDA